MYDVQKYAFEKVVPVILKKKNIPCTHKFLSTVLRAVVELFFCIFSFFELFFKHNFNCLNVDIHKKS